MTEEFFQGMGVKIVTRIRYLGDFVGDVAAEYIWLSKKVEGLVESVNTLAG